MQRVCRSESNAIATAVCWVIFEIAAKTADFFIWSTMTLLVVALELVMIQRLDMISQVQSSRQDMSVRHLRVFVDSSLLYSLTSFLLGLLIPLRLDIGASKGRDKARCVV